MASSSEDEKRRIRRMTADIVILHEVQLMEEMEQKLASKTSNKEKTSSLLPPSSSQLQTLIKQTAPSALDIKADTTTQTPWSVLNVTGHTIDPTTGKVDDTEGFGAFDSVMKLFSPKCPKNFDNGGGAFDDASKYVKYTYDVENVVYDPYMRPASHNETVLKMVESGSFDCCTSMSVLNVIDTASARREHITLCHRALKDGGVTLFKVWPGDGSGVPKTGNGRHQNNQPAQSFLAEIQAVFGATNVVLADNRTIKATKAK
jgi:hypothetical protein